MKGLAFSPPDIYVFFHGKHYGEGVDQEQKLNHHASLWPVVLLWASYFNLLWFCFLFQDCIKNKCRVINAQKTLGIVSINKHLLLHSIYIFLHSLYIVLISNPRYLSFINIWQCYEIKPSPNVEDCIFFMNYQPHMLINRKLQMSLINSFQLERSLENMFKF